VYAIEAGVAPVAAAATATYRAQPLLKGCNVNFDNVELLDEFIRGTISDTESPPIANNITHCGTIRQ